MGVQNDHIQYLFTDNRLQSLANLYEQAHKFIEGEEIKRGSRVSFQKEDRQPKSKEGQRVR